MGSPRINGSDFFGNPVEREGGVFSCPFDNSQTCQREPVFQTKNGGLACISISEIDIHEYMVH